MEQSKNTRKSGQPRSPSGKVKGYDPAKKWDSRNVRAGKRKGLRRLKKFKKWRRTALWYHLTHYEMIELIIQMCKCECPVPAASWFYRGLYRTLKLDIPFFTFIDAIKAAWETNVIEEDDLRQEVAILFHRRFRMRNFISTAGRICVKKRYFMFYLSWDVINLIARKGWIEQTLYNLEAEDIHNEYGSLEQTTNFVDPFDNELMPIHVLLEHELMNSIFKELPIYKRYFTYLWYMAGFSYVKMSKVLRFIPRQLVNQRFQIHEDLKTYINPVLLERPRDLHKQERSKRRCQQRLKLKQT